MNVYGARIAQARKVAGLTQDALAERLGVDVQTIKRRENPRGKEPKKLDRIAIATVCGVSIDYMEGLIDDVESAADGVVRKLREHDAQLQALRQELAALGEDVLRQLEQSEARLRAELRANADGSRPKPGAKDRP